MAYLTPNSCSVSLFLISKGGFCWRSSVLSSWERERQRGRKHFRPASSAVPNYVQHGGRAQFYFCNFSNHCNDVTMFPDLRNWFDWAQSVLNRRAERPKTMKKTPHFSKILYLYRYVYVCMCLKQQCRPAADYKSPSANFYFSLQLNNKMPTTRHLRTTERLFTHLYSIFARHKDCD